MMSLTFGLFTQVSGSGPLGPLVSISWRWVLSPVTWFKQGITTYVFTRQTENVSGNYPQNPILPKLGCHLSSASKFPDFSLTFYSFPYPMTDLKKIFLFFSLMVLTVSLQIWGLLLKERICSPSEQILSSKGSPQ